MAMKGGSFGAPKPLPGQQGFNRQKESISLENETNQMAERLQALRDQMAREKEIREASATQKVGGTKWKSARTDKSVRNYAKEVKDKYQQKVDAARAIPPSTRRARSSTDRSQTEENQVPFSINTNKQIPKANSFHESTVNGGASGNSTLGNVSGWNCEDVVTWLDSLGLSTTYKDVFVQNEITGPILLDVGLDDLDYMEVRKLAHRKVILKGIQDLKKNGRPTINLNVQSNNSSSNTGASDVSQFVSASPRLSGLGEPHHPPMPPLAKETHTTSIDEGGNCVGEVKPSSKVHWSQARPLSENVVKNDGNNSFVNLADGVYDEAAQAREFQAAVAAWRNGGSSDTNANSGLSSQAAGLAEFGFGPESDSNQSEWKNPWASNNESGLSGGSSATGTSTTVFSHKTPSLLDGVYDEAAQAREFQAAVAAWRNGGSSDTNTNSAQGNASTSSSYATGTVVTEIGESTGMNRLRAAEEVAAALGKKLDEQLSQGSKELAEKKREAEAQILKQQQEMKERRAKLEENERNAVEEWGSEHDDDVDVNDEEEYDVISIRNGIQSKYGNEEDQSKSEHQDMKLDFVDGVHVHTMLLDQHEDFPSKSDNQSDVKYDIIETTIGYTPRGTNEDEEDMGYAVVEEVDSDSD